MKTIENKETSLLLTEDTKLCYADLLMAVLNTPIREGITYKQMKADLALIGKVEELKISTTIEVSDEEVAKIKDLSEKHLWGVRHPDLVAFSEYIDSL